MAPKVTKADLLDAIRASLPPQGRPDGTGWYTTDELAAKLGKKRSYMRRLLEIWEEEGKAERQTGTKEVGRVERRINYYRVT